MSFSSLFEGKNCEEDARDVPRDVRGDEEIIAGIKKCLETNIEAEPPVYQDDADY